MGHALTLRNYVGTGDREIECIREWAPDLERRGHYPEEIFILPCSEYRHAIDAAGRARGIESQL